MSSFEPKADDPVAHTGFVANPLTGAAADFRPETRRVQPIQEPVEDVEARQAEAVQAAFEAGRAEGRGELPWSEAEELESVCAALGQASRGLTTLQSRYLRAQRRTVVELALMLARRILDRELAADPEAMLGILERALAQLPEGEAPLVTLAERDHAVLCTGDPPLLQSLVEVGGARFESDPKLSPGECRLVAGVTEVDASLDALLAPLGEALRELADGDPDAPGGAPAPEPEWAEDEA